MRPGLAVAAAVLLLLAGAGCYAVFVDHVLDRGESIVKESVKDKGARQPLILGGLGIVGLAASGLAGLAPTVRNHRLGPLAGFGLPLAAGAVVGASAFSLGRMALVLAATTVAPCLVTCLVACLTPHRDHAGPVRFLLRSWMGTGLLAGLALLAFGGLSLAQRVVPHVPWSSILASCALALLVQMAARYVAENARQPSALAADHIQRREAQDTPAIRAVSQGLHPFIEEGRTRPAYTTLVTRLGQAGRQPALAAPPPTAGPRAVPLALGLPAALARTLAFAGPAALFAPRFGLAAGLAVAAALFPLFVKQLAPRDDRLPWPVWLASAAAGAGAGVLAVSDWPSLGLAPALGSLLGVLPLLGLVPRLGANPAADSLQHARLDHARRLQQSWRRSAGRGLPVTVSPLLLPLLAWAVSRGLGFVVPALSWPVLLTVATAGALWTLAALLVGPAAAAHRDRLDQGLAFAVAQRREAHRTFLNRLELT